MDQRANDTSGKNELQSQILNYTARFEVPAKISLEGAWELFTINAENTERKSHLSFYPSFVFKMAASFAIILLASFTLYLSQNIEVNTSPGEFRTVTLPDNSTVVLNAGSSLQYNALTFSYFRKITFSGEGFFVVEKGSAFTVESKQGSTRVLGTQFNVFARGEKYEVACLEGKVEVNNSKSTVILTRGLKTKSTQHQQLTLQNADERSVAWQRGEFYFDNSSIRDVFETIEIQYGVAVEYSGDTNRTYTGYFTNKNLEEALQLVCLPLQLDYKIISATEIKILNTKK